MSLSDSDLKQFSDLLDSSLEKKIAPLIEQISTLPTKEEVAKLATKEEVANLATKEEVSKLATKDEIAKLATREEVSKLATKDEITVLRKMFISLPTKYNLAKLKEELLEKISHLPTKDQFYKKWING
jgi:glutamate racemase